MPPRTEEQLADLKAIRGADYEPEPEEGEERGPGLTPPAGHNSEAEAETQRINDAHGVALTNAAREKLKQQVGKIERLEEEQRELAGQKRDVYAEAKAMGYDTKALRKLVALRRMDRQEREEQEAILEIYMLATGDLEFYD